MCPDSICATTCQNNPEDVKVYIHRAITESRNTGIDILVAPYYEDHHWVLLVVWISRGIIFMYDSLRTSPMRRLLIMPLFSSVFRNICGGGGHVKKITWKQMKCAKQTGGLECGFYIMRFMFDVIKSIAEGHDLEQVYTSNVRDDALSTAEISEIRDMWAIFVSDNLL